MQQIAPFNESVVVIFILSTDVPDSWPKYVCPLQVPYETLNKRFRAAQKNIDRETSHVTMVVTELEKTLSSSFPVVDSVVSLLDGVVEKLSALKRKVSSHNHIIL